MLKIYDLLEQHQEHGGHWSVALAMPLAGVATAPNIAARVLARQQSQRFSSIASPMPLTLRQLESHLSKTAAILCSKIYASKFKEYITEIPETQLRRVRAALREGDPLGHGRRRFTSQSRSIGCIRRFA